MEKQQHVARVNMDNNDFALADAFGVLAQSFAFLAEWGMVCTEARQESYGCYFRWEKGEIALCLDFDYRDNFYYFERITPQGREPLLEFFAQRASAEGRQLNSGGFCPDKVGRREALNRYVAGLEHYRMAILQMAEDVR